MDNNHHNKNVFAGIWDDFSRLYSDVALQYTLDYSALLKEQAPEYDINQAFVLYVSSTVQEPIFLHQFQNVLLDNRSLFIIILAPYTNIHISDAVSLHAMTVHLVLQQDSHCIYEQEFLSIGVDNVKRQSIISAHEKAISEYHVLYAGNSSITHDYYSDAQGKNAHMLFKGIFCTKSRQKVVVSSQQRHSCIGAHSEILLKGFAAAESCVSYKGIITIEQNAINTIARQKHETLLLSDQACVESVPILEVLNKEVQCSHASAIGMLDPVILLYLQSRGLSKQKAVQMFLLSYVDLLYNNMSFEIKKKIKDLINSFDIL